MGFFSPLAIDVCNWNSIWPTVEDIFIFVFIHLMMLKTHFHLLFHRVFFFTIQARGFLSWTKGLA